MTTRAQATRPGPKRKPAPRDPPKAQQPTEENRVNMMKTLSVEVLHLIGMNLCRHDLRHLVLCDKYLNTVFRDVHFKYRYYTKDPVLCVTKALRAKERNPLLYEMLFTNGKTLNVVLEESSLRSLLFNVSDLDSAVQLAIRLPEGGGKLQVVQYFATLSAFIFEMHSLSDVLKEQLKFCSASISFEVAQMRLLNLQETLKMLQEKCLHFPFALDDVFSAVIIHALDLEVKRAMDANMQGHHANHHAASRSVRVAHPKLQDFVMDLLKEFFSWFLNDTFGLSSESKQRIVEFVVRRSVGQRPGILTTQKFLLFLTTAQEFAIEALTKRGIITGLKNSIAVSDYDLLRTYLTKFQGHTINSEDISVIANCIVQAFCCKGNICLHQLEETIQVLEDNGFVGTIVNVKNTIWYQLRIAMKEHLTHYRNDRKSSVLDLIILVRKNLKPSEKQSDLADYHQVLRQMFIPQAKYLTQEYTDKFFSVCKMCDYNASEAVLNALLKDVGPSVLRQLLKISIQQKIDPVSTLKRKLDTKCFDLTQVLIIVSIAKMYLPNMKPLLSDLEGKYSKAGYSPTFFNFIRTCNIDYYFAVGEGVFDADVNNARKKSHSGIATKLTELKKNSTSGHYGLYDVDAIYAESDEDDYDEDEDMYGEGYTDEEDFDEDEDFAHVVEAY